MLNWSSPNSVSNQKGRPVVDENMQQWFRMLCISLDVESDGELYTLQELHKRMTELAAGKEVYGMKRLKQKLIDKYKDSIFFAQIDGRSNVVCFRNTVNYILNDAWYDEKEKERKGRYSGKGVRYIILSK